MDNKHVHCKKAKNNIVHNNYKLLTLKHCLSYWLNKSQIYTFSTFKTSSGRDNIVTKSQWYCIYNIYLNSFCKVLNIFSCWLLTWLFIVQC